MKKNFVFLLILTFFCSFSSFAKIPEMPAGYSRYIPNYVYVPNLETCSHTKEGCFKPSHYDFDEDGLEDVFLIAQKDEDDRDDDKKMMVFLKDGKKILSSKPLTNCCAYEGISESGVVSVAFVAIAMRATEIYKFRFDKAVNDFWLIGFDGDYLGTGVSYPSGISFNLITGDYERFENRWNEKKQKLIKILKVKRKLDVTNKIYLQNLSNDSLDKYFSEN